MTASFWWPVRDAARVIVRHRRLLLAVTVMYLFSVLLGLLFPDAYSPFVSRVTGRLVSDTALLSWPGLFAYIFGTNLRAAATSLLLGAFLGVVPILSLMMNGYLVGSVIVGRMADGSPLVALKVLPHGIFELPAVLFAYTLGLAIGLIVFRRPTAEKYAAAYADAAKVFVFLILPLIVVGAGIETALFLIL
ncbi:stage II sporulation protein M [Candidatus Woesearchaeota archaeon]|nr:stage II sporulation protein M [Candidatus Woesearchaeota archaeon]